MVNINSLKEARKILNETGSAEVVAAFDNIIQDIELHGAKKQIINAGLLKAGKSTLFNAIIEKEEFETDVVRTTIKSKSIELENYVLVDTPGLDANDQDTEVAFASYKYADIIVFVHNVIDGELNKQEVDALKSIGEIFNHDERFLESSILVLSHADQLDQAALENLILTINNQCRKVFNKEFADVIAVNSDGYIKGVFQNKKLLIESSNITALKEFLDNLLFDKEHLSCYDLYLKKLVEEIKIKTNGCLEKTKKEQENFKQSLIDSNQLSLAKNKIKGKISCALNQLKNENPIQAPSITKSCFYSTTRSCRDYKSESDAKRAAKEACEAAIKSIASTTKTIALNTFASYEKYIIPDGEINTIKNNLGKVYAEIKEIYYGAIKNNNIVTPAFKIELKSDNRSKKLLEEFKFSFNSVKYISLETFSSANHYLTAYASNLDIDYDYRTEYVDGWFGSKEKEVKYYTWDIKGAVDDIGDSAKEIIERTTEYPRDKARELYNYYIEDINTQFQQLVSFFDKQLNDQILSAEKNNKMILANQEIVNKKNIQLEQFKKILETINL